MINKEVIIYLAYDHRFAKMKSDLYTSTHLATNVFL